jgi:hypothetical protein
MPCFALGLEFDPGIGIHQVKTQSQTGQVVNPGPYRDFAKRSAISGGRA